MGCPENEELTAVNRMGCLVGSAYAQADIPSRSALDELLAGGGFLPAKTMWAGGNQVVGSRLVYEASFSVPREPDSAEQIGDDGADTKPTAPLQVYSTPQGRRVPAGTDCGISVGSTQNAVPLGPWQGVRSRAQGRQGHSGVRAK